MRLRHLFWAVLLVLLVGWRSYIYFNDLSLYDIYAFAWPIAITMVFGAFICGATAEGGGAVAFPVMTLLLNILPADARVFSLGCQSFGMTSASVFILSQRIQVVKRCVLPVCAAGIIGFMVSDQWLVAIIPAKITKLFFVSLWLSFGFALWTINRKAGTIKNVDLPAQLGWKHILLLMVFGLFGGAISAIFGNGIDIITFTLLTLYFRIDEKIATPTSILLMTITTVFGFLWHILVRHDVSHAVQYYLLGAIPVCLSMAPMGAYVISKIPRKLIVNFLYIVLVVQFITAFWVIKPDLYHTGFSVAVVLIGLVAFSLLARNQYPKKAAARKGSPTEISI
ncbi:hypothetical protein GCM10023187_35120 [Nibrella viscosa]|uniref:Probable membrane transporter protein n=1 Tax=Nibrella viscosa TaxID=1084524 RepID=A0ABP8KNG0_9BACT